MEITEKDIKRIALGLLILVLAILAFLILRPVVLSIIAGLILAYVFLPVYNFIFRFVRNRAASAAIISLFVILLIAIPLWLLTPTIMQQVFETFQLSQTLPIQSFIEKLFPNASPQVVAQISLTLINAASGLTSAILNALVNLLLDFPRIALQLVIVAFVFFFTLKDKDSLRDFVAGLSPLNKSQEASLVKQFKGITQSIVYGQILIGIVQGILVGIGLFIFGVPNALILALLAVMFSIIPLVGPGIVYTPVTIYLIIYGNPTSAIIFFLYNFLFVSTMDNVLRVHIVSRRTDLSQVVVLVGMVGGLFIFGILGLILGPLILAYFLTFLRAYKDKELSSLFNS